MTGSSSAVHLNSTTYKETTMSRYDYYNSFPPYVSVAEKKEKAKKAMEKLKKKNSCLEPVIIEGSKIVKSWWGIAWCKNLELYADYENRIGRGRSYVRHGCVLDLKISSGTINALVHGSSSRPYKIIVKIKALNKNTWKKIKETCSGRIENLGELLQGKLPKEMLDIFTLKGKGLFPSPQEITFECSCPDWAYMCKHVASVLYGIGARFDNDPKLFFTLRSISIDELINQAVKEKSENMIQKSLSKTKRVMDNDNLSDVFGIDIKPGLTPNKKRAQKIKDNTGKKTNKNR
jgi:uncharacterized Zn finger protein